MNLRLLLEEMRPSLLQRALLPEVAMGAHDRLADNLNRNPAFNNMYWVEDSYEAGKTSSVAIELQQMAIGRLRNTLATIIASERRGWRHW